MTFESNDMAGMNPPTRSGVRAGTWAAVAVAVHDALVVSAPVVLTVPVGQREFLQIDIPRHSFEWPRPLDQFPVGATGLSISTQPAADPTPGASNLDGLLWTLGNNAFEGFAAPWLAEGQRVRLSRWPNMPRHMHSMQQMYMLAVLGNAYFTPAELATAAKASESVANDLINALSLMQLLKYSSEMPPPVIVEAPVEQAQSTSLFARLRARLGR